MPTTEEKLAFLQNDLIQHLKNIPAGTSPQFGKMTVQQMIEHFSDSVRIASGKTSIQNFVTPPEHLEKMQAFMLSDKPFRENTPNPLLPQIPPPVKHTRIEDALAELKAEIDYFVASFQQSDRITRNPFFGDLNFEQNIHLLHKHAVHHLKQFGVAAS
jgi:hypothetical protein